MMRMKVRSLSKLKKFSRIITRIKVEIFIFIAILSIIQVLFLHKSAKMQKSASFDTDGNNISCYTEPGDELPYVDDKFKPKRQSIYLVETSCLGGLNSRQACSVESAARWHPLWDIHVFFISPVRDLKHTSLVTLKKFRNVKFSRVNVKEYAKGTPIEKFVSSGAWMRTMWRICFTSDMLRYLTLYKWGGIYLDLDTVVVKPLGDLAPNWAARESDDAVANGALAFSDDKIGRMIAENSVRDFVKNWRGDQWGHNGPKLMYRVLGRICQTENVTSMNAETCRGFEVYNQKLFYPIEWGNASQYFNPPTTTYPDAYIHHVWNRITKHKKHVKGSLYDLLAKEHCPDIYMAYGNDFGMQNLYKYSKTVKS